MQIDPRRLHAEMLRIRLVEERIAEVYLEQEMRCPVHLCTGQEAIAVGVCSQLSRDDYVLSAHRSHGHYLARGGNLKALIAELYGKSTGCSRGKGGSMHLVDLDCGFLGATPIVGSTIPIAVGTAFGSWMKGEPRVTVVFFGEGATEEGVFHESMNFASLKRLPIVFICENNLYSVYSPLSVRQPKGRTIFRLVEGHGIECARGDGNNILQVAELTRSAISRARDGKGPVFLEFDTYRWREHCGPNLDNKLGYRTEAEFLAWKERDPVRRLRDHLLAEGTLTVAELDRITVEVETEIEEAFLFARSSPFPCADEMMTAIYAE